MSKKIKADFVSTDKTAADRHSSAKNPDVKAPVFAPELAAAKLPPEDAMVQQILERKAVFGF